MAEPVKFLSSRFLSASTPVGAEVRNPQDESLGDLKDVMVDSTSGRIAYGILTFGGVLGVGTKSTPTRSAGITREVRRAREILHPE